MIKVTRYTASWCGPCKTLAPIFNELAEDFSHKAEFTTIDIDQNKDAAKAAGISSVPTIVIEKDDPTAKKIVIVGLKPKSEYKTVLNGL